MFRLKIFPLEIYVHSDLCEAAQSSGQWFRMESNERTYNGMIALTVNYCSYAMKV